MNRLYASIFKYTRPCLIMKSCGTNVTYVFIDVAVSIHQLLTQRRWPLHAPRSFRELESMRGCFFFRSNFKPRTTIQCGFSRYLEISLKLVREKSLIVQREYFNNVQRYWIFLLLVLLLLLLTLLLLLFLLLKKLKSSRRETILQHAVCSILQDEL